MSQARISIPHELFAPAESFSFKGTYGLPSLKSGSDLYEFAQELAWDITVSNTGDALLVVGCVEGVARTACARCLEGFELELTGEIEGYYLICEESLPPEGMDSDEFELLPKDNVIDLSPMIKAALLLELPLIPLCDPDCKGLCPLCGQDRNIEACSCRLDAVSEEADGEASPFAVLKDFPFED